MAASISLPTARTILTTKAEDHEKLSQALLEAGRPHRVLPLSGVTHMTPQVEVAENLLLVQLEFLRDALSIDCVPGPRGQPSESPESEG